ncbi:hypothetical protein AHAS_Ahas13G0345300 [Arachis hypogaea]
MERDHMGYYLHPSSDSYYGGWRNDSNFGWQSQNQRNSSAPCSNYLEPPSPYSYQEPPSDIEAPQKKGVMEVNYIGSAPRNSNNDPYSKTYNQRWRNHPNFGWREQPQRPQNFNHSSQGGFQQNNFNNLQFQSSQQATSQPQQNDDLEEILVSFRQEIRASIKNLEIQMGQLATKVNEIDQSTTNSLPGNAIPNPREEGKAITLISRQVASMGAQVNEELVEKDYKVIQLRSGKVAGFETKVNEELVEKESYQEEEVEIKEACKEVEEFKEEYNGVELARPLPKPSPSNTTFKWVKFLSLILTFPLEYRLLETDGQLRALCGIKSKRKMVSGKSYQVRFNMVACSKLKCKDWYRAQLNESRRLFGCLCKNSDQLPPGGNNGDTQEDGCKSKVWDPGIHSHNQQSWGLVTCFNFLEGVRRLVWDPGSHWNYKYWWRFLDQYKHKPP